MHFLKSKLILFILIAQSLNCFAQIKNFDRDSILTTSIAKDFFNWYILSAKSGKHIEYNPIEIEDSNGMTTLDFSRYIQNLVDHSFSDSLISKERKSYNGCIKKLSNIKYVDYLKLDDLGDFEELEDDFTNYYRWTGGQDMFDFYKVTNVKNDNKGIIIVGSLYYDNSGNEKRDFIREITMTFRKQNNKWKIFEIKY